MKLKNTSPRRLLYLLVIVAIGLLGLLYSNARLQFYKDTQEANQKFLSTNLKQDTEAAQYYFYANYRPDTDYIAREATKVDNATFINVCQKSCALFRGKEFLNVCGDLSSEYKFKQYRVYTCNLKITLENDQPLKCEAIDNRMFNALCGKYIAFWQR